MFLIKIPKGYTDSDQIEDPFKELSLAYTIEISEEFDTPSVIEGKKVHRGISDIRQLMDELKEYYGMDYNCSCAR